MATSGASLGSLVCFAAILSIGGMIASNNRQQQPRNEHHRTMQRLEQNAGAAFRNSSVEEFTSNLPIVVLEMGYGRHEDGSLTRARFNNTQNGWSTINGKADF